ncbi:MAG TPA: YlmH/Sll1252 family protein [Caproicibacter sp.]|nr:YlmH/Sll1252 family protein [Caproicibacter sp.]
MESRLIGQDGLLEARITDAVRLAETGRRPRFVGFLDEHEAGQAAKLLEHGPQNGFLFWGGHPDAEHVVFGAFPEFIEPDAGIFPVAALTISYRLQDRLTHRDFLGALLHAGIERSSLGDILIEDGRAVVFCRQEISDFLCSQTEKIGGVGVRISQGFEEPLPAAHHFADFSAVVASSRLDCLVAAAARTSREKAAGMIRSQLVELNHEAVLSPSADVREGDILSVRGEGRFVIDRLGPVTKKGRLSIAGRKYI